MKSVQLRLPAAAALLASVALLVGLGFLATNALAAAPAAAGDPVKGQYIFAAAGGCGCHGVNLAGYKAGGAPYGEIFTGPFGSVPASNITPDQATGVGGWTDAQLTAAIRNGVDDTGKMLFPIMPYATYHFMSDADVADLVAFLRTVPAVANQAGERQLNGPVPPAPPLPPSPATAPAGGAERGRYLVTAVGDCGSCHTPTTPQGAPDMTKMLAGGVVPREGGTFEVGPNITPDGATGIGYWTAQNMVTYLKQGIGPNGRTADGLMGEVVKGSYGGLGFNRLTDADAAAMAAWLKTIPAVSNVPRAPQAPSAAAPAAAGAWEAQFQAAHGRAPTDQDRADHAWALNFLATTGRVPTDADWIAHWAGTLH
jgi:mono/diheme cytochrome c family protein